MLANQNDVKGKNFRDGVLTKRGTFQKYSSVVTRERPTPGQRDGAAEKYEA